MYDHSLKMLVLLVFATAGDARMVVAEAVNSRYVDSYPAAASKKGLQVEDVTDALALGIKHAAFNVDLCRLVNLAVGEEQQPHWDREEKRYYFNREYLQDLDHKIRTLSQRGVVVNLIILAYESADKRTNSVLLHPQYDDSAPNHLGMFNTVTPEGKAWLTAMMEFIAERWSRPDRKFGRVAGYIIGNEVNSHWWWANMGRVSMEEFVETYLTAVRMMHGAIRRQSSWARVYVSLDHHWGTHFAAGDDRQAFGGKAFIDFFARRAREGGDFDWHVAYHPYPENLFEPRFWNDETALPSVDTPRITFKNMEVLTGYLRRDELRYNGKPRRVILSEQGFHTPEGPDGEAIQAAAYCAAYKRLEQLEGIDAFILHRHVDHPHEGGLRLGLRSLEAGNEEARRKKLIYECFRAADTPDWEQAFEFALPIVGRESWE